MKINIRIQFIKPTLHALKKLLYLYLLLLISGNFLQNKRHYNIYTKYRIIAALPFRKPKSPEGHEEIQLFSWDPKFQYRFDNFFSLATSLCQNKIRKLHSLKDQSQY
jgi:hypothetical protein